MKIFFVILHYGGLSNTQKCLDSLCNMNHVKDAEAEILVVDNASPEPFAFSDNDCKLGRTHLLTNKENLGYSGGMNSGIRYALDHKADYVVVVNNDTEFDKEFLRVIVKRLQVDSESGIIVPKIYFYKGSEYHHDRYSEKERGRVIWYAGGMIDWKNVIASHRGVDEVDTGQYDSFRQTDFATGCCMVLRKELIEKIGMFDDSYYLYYEDIDLSMRVKKAGLVVGFEPSAVLWHKNAKSAGGAGSPLQDYYISRNRLLFGFRYAPFRARVAMLSESLRTMFSGRDWQKRGILDFYLGKFGKGSFRIS